MTEEERYAKVENDKKNALSESNKIYNELLQNNTNLTEKQNQYTDSWLKAQNEIADKNAEYQKELQNQNKSKAEQEFNNEAIASKNAYYDFINPYGANAEIQASNGLQNSGYSETSKVGAWNIQQNRTAKARASLNDAIQDYNNAIKEIDLNRDTTKMQYSLEALKQKLDASLNEFTNKSELMQNQLSNNQTIDNEYNNRYNNVWNQIQTEKEYEENIRQYEKNYQLQKQEYEENIRQFDENIKYLKEKDEREYKLEIEKLEEQKRQAELEQKNWEKEYQLSLQQLYSKNSSNNSYELSSQNISTQYYSGKINSDVQYGTFQTKDNNGICYQPNNVGGNKLSSVGKVSKYFGSGNVGATGANIDNQNLWTTNGRYYIWDGSQNKYIDVTSKMK